MKSFENNNPSSLTKRLGVSLNVDTGYNGSKTRREGSPPRTPTKMIKTRSGNANPNITGAGRALNGKTTTRETFLDDITPIDRLKNSEAYKNRDNRDSHDLSLSPRQITRDSLVDNMLLSLDQFSFSKDSGGAFDQQAPTADEAQLYSAFDGEEPYSSYTAPRNGRPAHGHSYSSDYENTEFGTRTSSQLSRGRRSNSSSNFQTTSRNINTAPVTNLQRPPQTQNRVVHSRNGKGGKGSRGSSASSLDLGYAQVVSNQRWTHGIGGRSSSFDFGQDRHAVSQINRQIQSPTQQFSYDYDAAPTPTVPGGPRKLRPISPNAAYAPDVRKNAPIPPTLERKRSTKSSKSAYKGRSDVPLALNHGLNDLSRELPPLPAFIKEPAPAPLVGYGKQKDAGRVQPQGKESKDKPGFFRRVFGSSKNNLAAEGHSHEGSNTPDSIDGPSNKPQSQAGQTRSQIPLPMKPPPIPKENSHVLTKKPSSFFRRRKKSVSESEPPLPTKATSAPVQLPPDREDLLLKLVPSPTSSLRQVMNPYLSSPLGAPVPISKDKQASQERSSLDMEEGTGFSPGYSPDAKATIRAVKPGSRDATSIFPHSGRSQSYLNTDNSPSRAVSSSSNLKDERTFLQDSSDNDREVKPVSSPTLTAGRKSPEKPVGLTPSQSVERDIALVAEYERAHAKRADRSEVILKSPENIARSSKPLPSSIVDGKEDSDEEEFIIVTSPSKTEKKEDKRVWLEPTSSEEDLTSSTNLALPLEGVRASARTSGSTSTDYKSATSVPVVQIEGEDRSLDDQTDIPSDSIDNPEDGKSITDSPEPTVGDRERAKKIYDGNEDFIQQAKAAAWLGEEGAVRHRTLLAYMDLYQFSNLNILAALRILCGKLVLKAESQQVDRILDAFSKRWCKCNPDHGFKVTDVVHTICYSILLLNTDLHLADIESKMTRSQFVKNTMPTILRVIADFVPDAFENRPSILPGKSSLLDSEVPPSDSSVAIEQKPFREARTSLDVDRPSWRASMKPTGRPGSDGQVPTPLNYATPLDDCGPLVKAPFHGTLRTWEVQVEIVLKDFYNSIRVDRLPLFGAGPDKPQLQQPSQSSLSVFTNSMLRRTPSVLSRAPSDTQSFSRGRTADTVRLTTGKWSTKNRSKGRVYQNSAMGSSRTSLDDQSSMWSPSGGSSTWSKYSLGKTQTSMSVDSFGSSWPQGDYQQSIGFANALSQAIIREETLGSAGSNHSEELRVAPLLEDESLELAGAPWAKEGIVKHKHHLEAADKKAKDRNWNETFAVIEKGYMTLFSFSSKSIRNKSRGKATGGVVGGGNWQDNAENLGSFLLRQTIASALPPPGYSKARPHVFALSLPTGAVHLFQVGTPEIVREFVSTANYWSARLSNHPLVGGISNIEYGWSDSIVNNPLVTAINENNRPSTSGQRTSFQSSIRSSLEHSGMHTRSRLPGDRVTIADWTPPTQSMRASNLMEQDQLRTLLAYVQGIEEELQKHNQFRSYMSLAYTPRQMNAQKAMANWEKKSSYLLREIVKFRTYIDCLQAAETQKKRIYEEREAEKAFRETTGDEEEDDIGDGEGDTTLKA